MMGLRRAFAAYVPQLEGTPFRSIKGAIRSRDRGSLHLLRRMYHLGMGLVCFGLYAFVLDYVQALILLFTVGGAQVAFDVLRLYFPQLRILSFQMLGAIMRKEELKAISASTYYILGVTTIVFLFPKDVVLLSVLFLALGDPAASIVGSLFGKRKLFGRKSLEGTLANLLVSTAVSVVFGYYYLKLSDEKLFTFSLLGGGVSTIAELIPLPVDDNFTIPVISALLLSGLYAWYGI